jgi:hypothetical protein
VDVATDLIAQRLWQLANQARSSHRNAGNAGLQALLEEVAGRQGGIQFGRHIVTAPPTVLWAAIQRVVRLGLDRDKISGEFTSAADLGTSMASLLGPTVHGTILDPFAGLGSLLWSAADRARNSGRDFDLQGIEINADVAALTSRLADLSPYRLALDVRDSFAAPPLEVADFVITEPPAGLHLSNRYRASGVGDVVDGDVAAIDIALRALRPGGRAILHLGAGWTFRGGSTERYRDRLLDIARIIALIGLPPGTFIATNIPSVLLVLDASPGGGETFVAQLGDDWRSQLSPGGAALTDFYERTAGLSR